MRFQMEKMTAENLPEIMDVMEDARKSVTKQEWFVADEEDYVKQVLEGNGFLVGAREEESRELAGFFMVFYPDARDNLGQYAGLTEKELSKVIYMDSAAVKEKYRGNGLQGRMLRQAEALLRQNQKEKGQTVQYGMCTIHPDNISSLRTMEKNGYEIAARRKLYGGLDRYILCKKIGSSL